MGIDIGLGVLFLGSVFTLAAFISRKIPELIAIPDAVIRQRLAEDSARVRLITVNITRFYREKKYLALVLRFWGLLLYRLHIAFLKMDNLILGRLKKLREKNNGLLHGMGNYWKDMQDWDEKKENGPE